MQDRITSKKLDDNAMDQDLLRIRFIL